MSGSARVDTDGGSGLRVVVDEDRSEIVGWQWQGGGKIERLNVDPMLCLKDRIRVRTEWKKLKR